jgi:hypothetical protein
MSREAAERYYSRRMRLLVERRARQEEWDFLARRLADGELTDRVGRGWHALVLNLHQELVHVDPDYRLYIVEEDLGGLVVTARFARAAQVRAARVIQVARAEALATCEVCGLSGALRADRRRLKTLCNACWTGDRAAAAARGERYADAVLAQLLSSDKDHPRPEETLAWLDALDADF